MKAKLDFGGQVVEVELRAMDELPTNIARYTIVWTSGLRTCSEGVQVVEDKNGSTYLVDRDGDYFQLREGTPIVGWIPEPIITVEHV